MEKAIYLSVHPIGDTNPLDMPVPDALKAAQWYEERMGFARNVIDGPDRSLTLTRDSIEIGLREYGGDPEQASCYIEVSDVDNARAELAANTVHVSEIRIDDYGGNKYRVFFAKDEDGICYCLGKKVEA